MGKRTIQSLAIVGALASIVGFLADLLPPVVVPAWLRSDQLVPTWSIVLVLGLFLLGVCGLIVSILRNGPIPSDARSVMNFVLRNELLSQSSYIDLCHYTAETLVVPWRHILEKHRKPLDIRLLVRRPEFDSRKQSAAEASLDAILEIATVNPGLNIDVRFYNDEPLLRLQFFKGRRVTCLAGVYRHDTKHPKRFVGAEGNALVVLRSGRGPANLAIEALSTRFELLWTRCVSLRGVIFDMDGVLIDSMPYHYQAWRKAFLDSGIRFGEEDFEREIYKREGQKDAKLADAVYEKYTGTVLPTDLRQKILEHRRRCYSQLSETTQPIQGILEVLGYLKTREVPMAVVTGSPREAAARTLERLFPSFFNVLVSADDVSRGKPHPDPYLKAIEMLRVEMKNQCLVVENAPLGVSSAASAEIPVIGVISDSKLEAEKLLGQGASLVADDHHRLLMELKALRFGDIRSQLERRAHKS